MLLHQLLSELDPQLNLAAVADAEIRRICEDSREILPGDLFIARQGMKAKGLTFIDQARARGAVAVVAPQPIPGCPLPLIILPDPGSAASKLAHILHRHPTRQVRVIGITGTNGKTTTAYLVRHLLNKYDLKCGMIGTVEIDDGQTQSEASMTTPPAIAVADLLGTMRDNGCKACAMETSSHALHQGRVSGIHFAGAAFTNLTGDHLDYHKTMEKYAASKAILFESLDEEAVAIINAEDPAADRMVHNCRGRVIRFGLNGPFDYHAQYITITSQGCRFILHTPDGRAEVSLGMIGSHNIANALTAAALVGEVFGLSVHQIAAGLKDAHGAPGRLQTVQSGQPFSVLVDYAHTDDALKNVLSALKPLARGKLRVLFGCGGDRDPSKRPRMAKVAAEFADVVYVTSDNPRTEKPDDILRDICMGFTGSQSAEIIEEPDRRSAIRQIISHAQPGDIVLLAGKGHENYQIIGSVKHHFDDVEEAKQALESLGANQI